MVRRTWQAMVMALLLLLTMCVSDGMCAALQTVRVLATTYPVYLLTRVVAKACPSLRVELLIPAQTGCPHEYALTPVDVRKLAEADIVVLNGLGLEAFMEKTLTEINHATIIDSSSCVAVLRETATHADSESERHASAAGETHGGHGHGHAVNPHAFTSPLQAAAMVRVIGEGLARAVPEAAACRAEAEACAARLETLAKRLQAIGNRSVYKDVILLHDGMAYLVRDAGLRLMDIIQEDEDVQPSAARLLQLAQRIRQHGSVLIMGEAQYHDKPVRTLAAETGAAVVVLDSLASGPAEPPTAYYEQVMENNCRILEQYVGN
ncbi:MAG: zinc ABC transporter substrate-binding protein [Desulfovibrio sp.]|nr:zinc ABC transporter substrate-binding protein [Desulfovibrio sp.]